MNILNTGVNPAGSCYVSSRNKGTDKLFVTNNNNYGITGEDSVSVFYIDDSGAYRSKVLNHSSFNQPYTATYDRFRNIVYISNSNSPSKPGEYGTITMVDATSLKIIGTIGDKTPENGGLDGPSGFAIYEDLAFVPNYGAPLGKKSGNGNSISVINLNTCKIIDTIVVDQAPACLTIDSEYLYVACYVDGNPGTGTLLKISLRNYSRRKRISGLSGPFNIVPFDGGLAVSNFGSNNFAPFGRTVSLIDTCEFRIIKNIDVGIQPSGLAVSKDKSILYVTCYNALYTGPNYTGLTAGMGSLATIDCKGCVIDTKFAGMAPGNVTIDRYGEYAYVSNYIGNCVTIIKL